MLCIKFLILAYSAHLIQFNLAKPTSTEGKPESSKAKDEKAKHILMKYFPDKSIYQINTTETNHNGGGLHCWSMQVPK